MLHLEDLESVVELEPENADARHKLAEILRLGYLVVGIDDDDDDDDTVDDDDDDDTVDGRNPANHLGP